MEFLFFLYRLAGIKSEGPEYDNRPYAADTMPLDYPNKIAETLENMVDGNKIAEDFDGEPNKLGMGYDNVRNRNKMSEPYDNTGDGADYVVSRKKRRALHHTVPRSSTTRKFIDSPVGLSLSFKKGSFCWLLNLLCNLSLSSQPTHSLVIHYNNKGGTHIIDLLLTQQTFIPTNLLEFLSSIKIN